MKLFPVLALTFIFPLFGITTETSSVSPNQCKDGVIVKNVFNQQIAAGITEMQKWIGSDSCIVFPVIADLHSNLKDEDPLNSQKRITIHHLGYWLKTAQDAGADFAVDLGDNGFEIPLKTEDQGKALLQIMEKFYLQSPGPVIHCVGNHDIYFKTMDGTFWGAWLKRMNGKKAELITGGDGSYGYFDIPEKRCRIFYLNTSDQQKCGISPEQISFVKKHLNELSQKETAVVFTHVSPLNRARWRRVNPSQSPFRFLELSTVLHDFTACGGNLAGVFSGDSHADYFDFIDGINYFVTQGYGGCCPVTEKPQQMTVFHQYNESIRRSDSFNTNEFCLIDLVAIKLQKREIRIFRIGAGGFEFNRGAKF